ncbi:alpha-1,2-fucosyltransferase, partial [Clostridium perfringens]
IRREKDRRSYAGLFRRDGHAITGIAKLAALLRPYATVEKFADPTFLMPPKKPTRFEPLPHVIAPDYFNGLFDYHDLITSRLIEIIATQHLRQILATEPADVAVHVRLGDFSEAAPGAPITANTRLPLSWFADRIAKMRSSLPSSITVKVFSDGTPDQLSALLEIDGVSLSDGQNAIVDMFSMARSRMLIASASTYSMWASFLGKMPSLWHPNGGLIQ